MRTGGTILADLAQNTNSDVTPRDIVSKHLSELVGKVLSGRGRKQKRNHHNANQSKDGAEEEECPAAY